MLVPWVGWRPERAMAKIPSAGGRARAAFTIGDIHAAVLVAIAETQVVLHHGAHVMDRADFPAEQLGVEIARRLRVAARDRWDSPFVSTGPRG